MSQTTTSYTVAYNGLQANVFTMGLISSLLGVNKYAFFILVGAINISIAITPFALGRRIKKLPLILFGFIFFGFVFAIFPLFVETSLLPSWAAWSPALASLHLKFLYGYFSWVAGYLLQIVAISYWLWHSDGDLTLRSSGTAQKRAAP